MSVRRHFSRGFIHGVGRIILSLLLLRVASRKVVKLREERRMMMESGCLIILKALLGGARSFSGRLFVQAIGGGCAHTTQQLACFYLS